MSDDGLARGNGIHGFLSPSRVDLACDPSYRDWAACCEANSEERFSSTAGRAQTPEENELPSARLNPARAPLKEDIEESCPGTRFWSGRRFVILFSKGSFIWKHAPAGDGDEECQSR